MPECVVRNRDFLNRLHSCKRGQRSKIIKRATRDNINALSEVAINTLLGNIPLNPAQKSHLKRHRSKIRVLAHRHTSVKKKKDLLVQKGGFLPFLLTPLLSIIGGLAANALSKVVGL